MKKNCVVALGIATLVNVLVVVKLYAETAAPIRLQKSGVDKLEEVGPGVLSISSSAAMKDKKQKANQAATTPYDLVKDLTDDSPFLEIGEDDILKWGDVRDFVDSLVGTQFKGLFGNAATENSELNNIHVNIYGSTLSNILSNYALTALVAQEARKEGLTISDADIASDLATIGKRGKKLYPLQYQLVTNMVYQRAYIDKHIKPNIEVTDDEIATLIKWRHDSNLSVPLTNAVFKAKLEDIRRQIADGSLDFSEAAEEYSECSECSSENGDCGPWEEDLDDFDPALKEFCFSAPTNVLSDVIEGEEAFHLVKIKSRYVPTQKARDEDGEVSSVEVKHIQIDKWLLDPEYTRETAIKFIERQKIGFELSKKQQELIENAPIKSVLPLYPKRRGRVRGPDFRK